MAVRDKDETIILRVPSWMKGKLLEQCAGRSLSDFIRSILTDYLIKNKDK